MTSNEERNYIIVIFIYLSLLTIIHVYMLVYIYIYIYKACVHKDTWNNQDQNLQRKIYLVYFFLFIPKKKRLYDLKIWTGRLSTDLNGERKTEGYVISL